MEKMERCRFVLGGVIMVLIIGALAVLVFPLSVKRPTLDELAGLEGPAKRKRELPSFEELVGPTAQKNPGLPSLEELVEGLPTPEELLASDPQLLAERQTDALEALEWQLPRQNSRPQVFQWEDVPQRRAYDIPENPLAGYMAERRLHQRQREDELYRINMMNAMTSIQGQVDQSSHKLQQGNYQANTFNPTPPHLGAFRINKYHPDSLANPYGAGSPYKPDGLMNPYSQYGSPYSNKSWRNPYATNAPKLYDSQGNYRGNLSSNPYQADSVSNPYGRYGSKYSGDSINNPYGAGNPYSQEPIYVVPSK